MENKTVNTIATLTDADYESVKNLFGAQFIAERDAALVVARDKEAKKAARAAKAKSEGKVKKVKAVISKQCTAEWSAAKIMGKVEALCSVREKYETETLARSNKELYSILSDVYKLFLQAVREDCLKAAVTQMRAVLVKRGMRVQKNTNALTLFVRYVFNNDRKRAYNYASTLQAALQAEVDADVLAEFIESKNGVEECKREFRKSDETKSKEAQLADARVCVVDELSGMKAQQVVKLAGARAELADGTRFVFVVARANADGTLELLRVVNKTTVAMQNAAVKELAKIYAEEQAAVKIMAAKAVKKAGTKVGTVKVTAKDAAKLTMLEFENA
jgi:hypothetical protein